MTNEAIEFLKTIFEFLISSLYPNFLTTWTVLRKFGYNDDIKLADDLFPPLKYTPDQVVLLRWIVATCIMLFICYTCLCSIFWQLELIHFLFSLDLISAECWVDKWSHWILEDNFWCIWCWFCMSFPHMTLNNFNFSCCSPIIFGHFLDLLHRYTKWKLTIYFPSSRMGCCDPVNLKNCFPLPQKGKLISSKCVPR